MGEIVERELKGTGVPHDMVDDFWSESLPWIESALKHGHGEFEADDIHDALVNKDMQLWVIYEKPKNNIVLVVVTQILDYPRMKVCRIVVLGGESHLLWETKLFILEEWAKEQGCKRIEAYCRDGLQKKLEKLGYKKLYNWVGVNL